MLYAVTMDVSLPPDMDPEVRTDLMTREKTYAQGIQRGGEWPQLWRIVGRTSNLSIFDVESHERLHEILAGLPLYPYLTIEVRPLATHPSKAPDVP
ncbi:muconolactone Delta-isomerase family protein [Lapillicoccus sp.]|jgi:muconolactone D-isomerase|uniref:muconolactone Delta-isomerase family protein n=1 Tax=Lapillicoccus sp. TaxID=1909287 RepID=UPI0025CF4406|nr:muconolactone Delta-isomerase family protein [Lapillicoccus sp.]